MKIKISLFWFRRDLRLEDNAGLYHALESGFPVLPIFIFDETILRRLDNKRDRRVDYFHQALVQINLKLRSYNSSLKTFYGRPLDVFKQLNEEYDIRGIYCNRDYEPQAIRRDTEVYKFFAARDIPFKAFKDQVIFDKSEVLKENGKPYTVFTPYARKWEEILTVDHYKSFRYNLNQLVQRDFSAILSLEEIGFEKTEISYNTPELDKKIIIEYEKYRDFPGMEATSQLGMALRFGTISIRTCVAFAVKHSKTWLKELIWREFFKQILYHFPEVEGRSFKLKYDRIEWQNNEVEFQLWCAGETGYPLVDAGMRQLNETGFMHNRVRMVTASFLCKHLLIDWRWGEAYFAEKLNDYDLSANNGNWQWVAGSGCDAAPYFRIFNPILQANKFDKEMIYIKRWIPEYGTDSYPAPMVEHAYARERAMKAYKKALE